jgi:hypothetical protein
MTQAEKTQLAFDAIAKMTKEKSKYLVRIALQHPERDDLKTLFRKYDDEK